MIKFAEPWITEQDKKAVSDTLESKWIAQGPKVTEFEEAVAKVSGTRYAVATNSATMAAAIFLDYLTKVRPVYARYNVQPIALMPAITFPSIAVQLLRRGWKLEIAEVNPETWCMEMPPGKNVSDYDLIIPTDFAGARAPAYSNQLWGTPVLVDAACSFGLPIRKDGGVIAAVHSFYANKIITTGNGGALVTDDEALYDYAKKARLHGLSLKTYDREQDSKLGGSYDVEFAGLKANMTDMQAALGLSQLSRLQRSLNRRETIYKVYVDGLKEMPRVDLQKIPDETAHCMMPITINPELHGRPPGAEKLRKFLLDKGIQTSMHYPDLRGHRILKDALDVKARSGFWEQREITLPMHPNMTAKDTQKVVDAIGEYFT